MLDGVMLNRHTPIGTLGNLSQILVEVYSLSPSTCLPPQRWRNSCSSTTRTCGRWAGGSRCGICDGLACLEMRRVHSRPGPPTPLPLLRRSRPSARWRTCNQSCSYTSWSSRPTRRTHPGAPLARLDASLPSDPATSTPTPAPAPSFIARASRALPHDQLSTSQSRLKKAAAMDRSKPSAPRAPPPAPPAPPSPEAQDTAPAAPVPAPVPAPAEPPQLSREPRVRPRRAITAPSPPNPPNPPNPTPTPTSTDAQLSVDTAAPSPATAADAAPSPTAAIGKPALRLGASGWHRQARQSPPTSVAHDARGAAQAAPAAPRPPKATTPVSAGAAPAAAAALKASPPAPSEPPASPSELVMRSHGPDAAAAGPDGVEASRRPPPLLTGPEHGRDTVALSSPSSSSSSASSVPPSPLARPDTLPPAPQTPPRHASEPFEVLSPSFVPQRMQVRGQAPPGGGSGGDGGSGGLCL